MKCPNCSTENPSGKFCKNCGKPLALVCPQCQTANPPDARFCTTCGASLSPAPTSPLTPPARPAPVPDLPAKPLRRATQDLEGERKPVTILFTDIVGSTTHAEKLDPEEWKEIVNGAHRRVSDAVYRFGGIIAQFLGDGVLAFFGAPVTHEDDPVRAVRAAFEIQQTIGEYSRSLAGYVDNFQMRIGINTGLVILGNVGTDQHLEYLAVGDAVNLAARLQSAAQPGKVLLSEATARFVRATFNLEPLGEITVKGKSEPVRVHQVIGPKAVPEKERGIEGLVSPLVGREHEIQLLRAALSDLAQGHGHVVSIIGEPGIGKSRLAQELRGGQGSVESGQSTATSLPTTHYPSRRIASDARIPAGLPTIHWLEGRSLSYGQTLAFWTISQLIRADLGVSDIDPEPKVRTALRKRLQSLFGERSTDALPYLAHLLGLELQGEEADRIRILDGETLKQQVLLTISRYFERVANTAPTVLVFEDLHWADPSTLQALEQLLEVTDRAPLLLLLLFRPERDLPSWRIKIHAETDYPHRYTEIALQPLSVSDSNELITSLLHIADLPDSTRNLILHRSEGNPFYLEEIVRHLIDRQAIVREDGHWRATRDLESIEIPETLQGVLLARMDRLDDDVRRTLQLASVIGRSFLYRLLQAIGEAERELRSIPVGLDRHLSQLQRADLIREQARRPELEYIFKHSLTQEAAYNSLLVERRREFHLRVGQALEDLFADRKEEFSGLLAYHFDRAGEQEKAIEYLLAAGDRMRLEDAHTEAIGYYRRAVELLTALGDAERAANTWLKLALVYHSNFEFEAAHQANEAAFALRQAVQVKQPQQRARPQNPVIFRVSPPLTTRLAVSLDPAFIYNIGDIQHSASLFAGIAEIDREMNVVPHAARSWQVLDQGTRYVIHLRDDVFWTDGTRITAEDYVWAWKRNLAPATRSDWASALDDIVGARDYREGRNPDPESIGVRALDPFRMEVRLNAPTAYFPYILASTSMFPLPRETIERFGADWWKPEHIVSNGPFRLTAFSDKQIIFERNPDYFGEFKGNVDRVQIESHPPRERLQLYLENSLDLGAFHESPSETDLAQEVLPGERVRQGTLNVQLIQFMPNRPPLHDVRVRCALAMSLDRKLIATKLGLPPSAAAHGGIIPSGMPGHSPDIGLPFDVEEARRLLKEAGYPGGANFPVLKLGASMPGAVDEIVRQWREHLGVVVDAGKVDAQPTEVQMWDMYLDGWVADYPDPDGFHRNSEPYLRLKRWANWRDEVYEGLIEDAAHTTDRAKRMSMYRKADRMWVTEQVLVAPLVYGSIGTQLIKPWVEHIEFSPQGTVVFKSLHIGKPLP